MRNHVSGETHVGGCEDVTVAGRRWSTVGGQKHNYFILSAVPCCCLSMSMSDEDREIDIESDAVSAWTMWCVIVFIFLLTAVGRRHGEPSVRLKKCGRFARSGQMNRFSCWNLIELNVCLLWLHLCVSRKLWHIHIYLCKIILCQNIAYEYEHIRDIHLHSSSVHTNREVVLMKVEMETLVLVATIYYCWNFFKCLTH